MSLNVSLFLYFILLWIILLVGFINVKFVYNVRVSITFPKRLDGFGIWMNFGTQIAGGLKIHLYPDVSKGSGYNLKVFATVFKTLKFWEPKRDRYPGHLK